MQMQPLPQPSRCVHTPVAPGTRAGTRGDTSILHPPSYPLTSYLLTSYLPSYSELNPNTAKNHPLRLSEQSHSRLLYGARRPSHIGRWPNKGSIHPSSSAMGSRERTCAARDGDIYIVLPGLTQALRANENKGCCAPHPRRNLVAASCVCVCQTSL